MKAVGIVGGICIGLLAGVLGARWVSIRWIGNEPNAAPRARALSTEAALALPRHTATRAALVQLTVPIIAALGAVVLLGEAITERLVTGGAVVVAGVALAIAARALPRVKQSGERA